MVLSSVHNENCFGIHFRGRVNREVQTVNWEAGKEGAVETGVKSGLTKAHKPWIRGKNRGTDRPWIREGLNREVQIELGSFNLQISSFLRGPNWGLFLSWNSCVHGFGGETSSTASKVLRESRTKYEKKHPPKKKTKSPLLPCAPKTRQKKNGPKIANFVVAFLYFQGPKDGCGFCSFCWGVFFFFFVCWGFRGFGALYQASNFAHPRTVLKALLVFLLNFRPCWGSHGGSGQETRVWPTCMTRERCLQLLVWALIKPDWVPSADSRSKPQISQFLPFVLESPPSLKTLNSLIFRKLRWASLISEAFLSN